jgi:hypothetical protein
VRQLELSIIDVKATTERKVTQLADEVPTRLQREIRNFEQKEV